MVHRICLYRNWLLIQRVGKQQRTEGQQKYFAHSQFCMLSLDDRFMCRRMRILWGRPPRRVLRNYTFQNILHLLPVFAHFPSHIQFVIGWECRKYQASWMVLEWQQMKRSVWLWSGKNSDCCCSDWVLDLKKKRIRGCALGRRRRAV